jgi:uncharacterized protein (TIGR03437 family)
MPRVLAAIALVLWMLVTAPAFAQSAPDLSALDGILDRASLELQTDIELVVLHRDTVVYRRKTEGRGGVGTLAIASASKWLAAATVQSMVDEGLLSWDDPAGLHLFYFRGDKAAITLRQLFSHTSGLRVEFECLQDRTRTMDNCVQTIAGAPLLYPPGTALHYGDASLQVGGRVAETVSKRFWEDLFQQRIPRLTGMQFTTFQPDGPTINPDVAAGAFSTTDDYLNLVRMLAAKGIWAGTRVLSRRGVDIMLADQMRGARIASSFYAADETLREGASRNRYGLGNWLEGAAEGVSIANSSQGAFGVSPYIDRRRDLVFLAFLRDQSVRFNRYYYQIQDLLQAAYPVPPVEPDKAFREHTIPHGGAERTAYSYTPDSCQAPGAQCPVLVAFHPQGSDARSFAQTAKLTTLAEREELILVLWEGLSSGVADTSNGEGTPKPVWNLAPDFGEAVENDTRLAPESLRFLPDMPGADPERIYLLGFLQGADLAAMAACRYPDTFAAVVLVAPEGRLRKTGEDASGIAVCHPMSQVPVMLWGTPTGIGDPDSEPAPNQQASFWAEHNQCTAQTQNVWQRGALNWRTTAHSGCHAGASVLYVEGETLPEQWPADGAELSWEFLRGYASRVRAEKAVVQTNAASYERRRSAPAALASLFGKNLALETAAATGSELPVILGGVRVEVRDREGTTRNAPLVFVSPGQINLLIPGGLAPGVASAFVYRGLDLTHLDWLYLQLSAPGLFAADAAGSGPAAGEALYVLPNGSRRVLPLFTRQSVTGATQSHPVHLGEPGAEIYLSLYGTGFRGREPEDVTVWLGDTALAPVYAGPQGSFAGLDQLNLRLDSIPAEIKDALPGRAIPLTVCTPDGCSNRLELRFAVDTLPSP